MSVDWSGAPADDLSLTIAGGGPDDLTKVSRNSSGVMSCVLSAACVGLCGVRACMLGGEATYAEGHLMKVMYICLVGLRYIGVTRVSTVCGRLSADVAKTVNVVVLSGT